MNKLEDRLRHNLSAAAERLPETGTRAVVTPPSKKGWGLNGPRLAVVVAGAVVLLLGGSTLLFFPSTTDVADTTPSTLPPGEVPAPWYLPDHIESEFQAEILSDAVVTYEELQQAMSAFVNCVQDHGFPDVTGSVTPSGESEIGIVWGRASTTKEEQTRFESALDSCEQETFAQVGGFYGLTHPQAWHDPYTAEVSTQIAACMSQQGVEFDPTPEGTYDWQQALEPFGQDVKILFIECEGQALPSRPDTAQPPPEPSNND
jgi:hypothetical protein